MPSFSYSQNENIWTFGHHAGLDFNSGSPVAIETNIEGYGEAQASVCDENGELLFYTEGTYIWDKNGNIMPNGNDLTSLPPVPANFIYSSCSPTSSSAQGTVIVPMPNDTLKYYVFSISSIESAGGGRLFYSIVDMSLNNGLGDVIANQKGILVDSGLTEMMTVLEGNDCNIWLVVTTGYRIFGDDTPCEFRAFEITTSGINLAPVVSSTNYSFPIIGKSIRSNGTYASKIAASARSDSSVGLLLSDFDGTSGMVNNFRFLSFSETPLNMPYSVCFSPDNSKLYFSTAVGAIYQYDISFQSPSVIQSSLYSLGTTRFTDLKLGPDGRIYFFTNSSTIGSINQPDLAGAACQITLNSVPLISQTYTPSPTTQFRGGGGGFPNLVVKRPLINDTLFFDTLLCNSMFDSSAILRAPLGYDVYKWENGSSDVMRIVKKPGIYWLQSKSPCGVRIDTFKVVPDPEGVNLGTDTVLCHGGEIEWNLPVSTDVEYRWQDGSINRYYTADTSGVYWVEATRYDCKVSDTAYVSISNLSQNLGGDIPTCKGQNIRIKLDANVPGDAEVRWSTNERSPTITIVDTGLYWVYVEEKDGPCFDKDTIRVYSEYCNCIVAWPNVFSPNGDGLNDVFKPIIEDGCPVRGYVMDIYNRYGQLVYRSNNPERGWDGLVNSVLGDVGVYFFKCSFEGGERGVQYYRTGDVTLIR